DEWLCSLYRCRRLDRPPCSQRGYVQCRCPAVKLLFLQTAEWEDYDGTTLGFRSHARLHGWPGLQCPDLALGQRRQHGLFQLSLVEPALYGPGFLAKMDRS